MKKIITIFLIVILLIISFAIFDRSKPSNEEYEGFFINTSYSFDTTSKFGELIYFIGRDNILYRVDSDFNEETFFDNQMKFFTFTKEHLIYIDMDDLLHIVLQFQFIDKTMDVEIASYEDCIISDDGIVYKDGQGNLLYLEFLNWKTRKVVDEKVEDFMEYEGNIAFRLDAGKDIKSSVRILDPIDGEINQVINKQLDNFLAKDGYIYYDSGRSLNRMSVTGGMSERLVKEDELLDFHISGSMLLIKTGEKTLNLYDIKKGLIREIAGEYISINSLSGDAFLCMSEKYNSMTIISKNSEIVAYYTGEQKLLNASYVDDYIFTQIGSDVEGDGKIVQAKFYDKKGNEIYVH